MKTLFLSCGHNWGKNNAKGIPDQGALGNGTSEAIETNRIINIIIEKGIPGIKLIKVPNNYNLDERINWVNRSLPYFPDSMAIEFHLDSAGTTATGASVWYNDDNQYTLNEGKQFLAKYTDVTGLKSRHVNSDTTNRLGQLGWVSKLKCASLLVELGFISNAKELETIRKKGVEAIIAGIIEMNSK